MTKIFAVSNQKGGVGKTTTAVNLAASISAAEFKVLLIDLDPQGNASSGLGVYPSDQAHSIYDVLVDETAMSDAILNTELPFLDLVYANQDLIGAEVELINALGREHRLKEALAAIKDKYDYIVIDCPPALGLLTVNALAAADGVIIPLQCEYYAMEGMSQLLRTIQLIQKRINPNLELEGIVLTMYD
ncbi:MAG: chromosome partitioning protein ParA, partial [Phototrophicales bacterium]